MGSVTTGQEAVVVNRLRQLSTTAISDALDRKGSRVSLRVSPRCRATYRAAGSAFTIRYAPADSASGTVGDFLDEVPHVAVIVIDNDIPPGRVLSPRGSGRANVACCGTSRLIDFSWVKEDSRSVKGGT